jgi:hypothetical protein
VEDSNQIIYLMKASKSNEKDSLTKEIIAILIWTCFKLGFQKKSHLSIMART